MKTIELGAVHLNVTNVEQLTLYYENLGFTRNEREDAMELLAGNIPLVVLHPTRQTRRHEVGLYHLAIRVPERKDLGNFLYHLAASRIPVTGFSDHHVSEAIYLTDPEGNGIEVYWDKPENIWKNKNRIHMTTDTMDVDGVLESRTTDSFSGFPEGTDMGHIHLHVKDLDASDLHYNKTLGLEKTLDYPKAGFFSRDGYHHHIGMNMWLQGNPAMKQDGYPGIHHFSIHLDPSVFEEIYGQDTDMVENRDPNNILYKVYRGFL
ncbi:VOC family protein [Proteiniclasticum sp. C24MP]|uniref:VOC family protein n=1 Tax=Proteiniclasticum sp. C24MP TaxID=3374101 RepID=UPI0037543828